MPLRLTSSQVEFFRENGYLILRGALDAEACAALQQRVYATAAPPSLVPGDFATQTGPWPAADETPESCSNYREGFSWRVRTLGTDKDVLELACK